MANPIVTFEMQDGGKIVAELYPDIAPQSVYNFIALANAGYYDGLIFHRVIPGFMIQGGSPWTAPAASSLSCTRTRPIWMGSTPPSAA